MNLKLDNWYGLKPAQTHGKLITNPRPLRELRVMPVESAGISEGQNVECQMMNSECVFPEKYLHLLQNVVCLNFPPL